MTNNSVDENDLWPDEILQTPTIRPPVAILKEQATFLASRTNNTLKGEVHQNSDTLTTNYEFEYAFYITAPGINYKYRLFTLMHNIEMYPLRIDANSEIFDEIFTGERGNKKNSVQVGNEAVLKTTLRKIFKSAKVQKVVTSLLALIGYEKNKGEFIPF